MTSESLLIELFTEELPPRALKDLGEALGGGLYAQLKKLAFLEPTSLLTTYATPRRLAAHLTQVRLQAPDSHETVKLMPVNIALDAQGQATPAFLKKLAALGIDFGDDMQQINQLERRRDGKNEALFYTRRIPGNLLPSTLHTVLQEVLRSLPIAKMMNYQIHPGTPQQQSVQFIRPVHQLIAMYGAQVIPMQILGRDAGFTTGGHRFFGLRKLTITHADHYARELYEQGKVISNFDQRRAVIRGELQACAAQVAHDAQVIMPEALLDEVTALVEWPVVYVGEFDEQFLSVPQECLILTMQQNQKYFALSDAQGKMLNRFLLVSNIATDDPTAIIQGNQRVLRARLADAKFFFDQDRKKTLASRVAGLDKVVYHNQLGSQAQRVQRIEQIAKNLAATLGMDLEIVQRAAHLAKADLLTDMVSEFPELQGIMGQYYAQQDGEAAEVACAIAEHYHPRFAGDVLPKSHAGLCVALADKLETLVGLFSVGQQPSGEKDPFALRRHALGVLRMLIEKSLPLDLPQLLHSAAQAFGNLAPTVVDDLGTFLSERARSYLKDAGFTSHQIEAVINNTSVRPSEYLPRLAAVQRFQQLPEAKDLAEADKRIRNILAKSHQATAWHQATPDVNLFQLDAEKRLFNAVEQLAAVSDQLLASSAPCDYQAALLALAAIHQPVADFFAEVMVNVEDEKIRVNRIALLHQVVRLTNQVANLSKLT